MGKNLDALKAFSEFRAPWETETGEDAEIDKAKLKRYIHGILTDKAKAQDARDDADAEATKLTSDLDEANANLAKATPDEANKRIEKLTKQVEDLTAKNDELTKNAELTSLRGEVLAGLDSKYAKYVTGTTREELEASLASVKSDFGLTDDGDSEDDDEEEAGLETKPKTKMKTSLVQTKDDATINYDDAVAEILARTQGGII